MEKKIIMGRYIEKDMYVTNSLLWIYFKNSIF